MPWTVRYPARLHPEISWVVQWLFGRIANICYALRPDGAEGWIAIARDGVELRMPLIYLDGLGRDGRPWPPMLGEPSATWTLDWPELARRTGGHRFPVLLGRAALHQQAEQVWTLDADLIGSSFFCLSRAEEVVNPERDAHARFPARSSHAWRHGYLEIPLADYYAECVLAAMARVWPNTDFIRTRHAPQVSHDVDSPSLYAFRTKTQLLRSSLADLLIRRDLRALTLGLRPHLTPRHHIDPEDPHNTFPWIMETVERAGLRSTYYFLAGHHAPAFDADYRIDDPRIRDLLRALHQRGHHIGLHPSYTAGLSEARMRQELAALQDVTGPLGVGDGRMGARMHYLRWLVDDTWAMFANLGITHDATLGYADHIGFRASTCHPFRAYSLKERRVLDVEVRPLLVMEASLIDPVYMNMGATDDAFERVDALRKRCNDVQGCFTLLWHNSRLVLPAERAFFARLLATF
jgi:hypothetical protein